MKVGIDEVGRGSWAGPLTIAVAGFHLDSYIPKGLADSKQLTKSLRALLVSDLEWCHYSIGWASPCEIDLLGLTKATQLAILRALGEYEHVSEIIIDGSVNFLTGTNYEAMSRTQVKADQDVPEVMCASVIAKEARDAHMRRAACIFPEYGFEAHVGYGTKQHSAALKEYGVLPLHRKSYSSIKRLSNE